MGRCRLFAWCPIVSRQEAFAPSRITRSVDLRRCRRCRDESPSGDEAVALVAKLWHCHAMTRMRVSTTVDEGLLGEARQLRSDLNDAALLDEALTALLARHREAEIDVSYAAYDEHPLDEADEWGDLASFREAAAS